MKRERKVKVPKSVRVTFDDAGNMDGVFPSRCPNGVRYVLPSPSTVEKRLRDAVVKAAMAKFLYEYRNGLPDEFLKRLASHKVGKDSLTLAQSVTCARLELHLRATRKDAR